MKWFLLVLIVIAGCKEDECKEGCHPNPPEDWAYNKACDARVDKMTNSIYASVGFAECLAECRKVKYDGANYEVWGNDGKGKCTCHRLPNEMEVKLTKEKLK